LVVQSGRPWPEDVTARINEAFARHGVIERLQVIEAATMAASPEGRARLVELRAVEAGFPYYGTLTLGSGRVFDARLLADRGVIVQPELLVQIGAAVGDTIQLAGQPFVVRDTVTRDRVQGRGGFAFGPRVYLAVDDLR